MRDMNRRFFHAAVTAAILGALLVFFSVSGCSTEGGGQGNTITGSITGGTHPLVALFDDTYWFTNDISGARDPDEVDDESAMKVARDIAKKVEDEMTYPGEIQVTLLREVRCVEYAK